MASQFFLPGAPGPLRTLRIRPIIDGSCSCSPMFLEGNESEIIRVGAPQIEFFEALLLRLFNGLPKQEGHASEFVERCDAATVLIDHTPLVEERQDAGYWQVSLGGNANFKIAAECGHQATKPSHGLGRQVLPAASGYQEPVELSKQSFRAPFFVFQSLTFRASNFSLHAVFVEVMKQLLCASTQIQPMKLIVETFFQSGAAAWSVRYWPDFEILPFPFV